MTVIFHASSHVLTAEICMKHSMHMTVQRMGSEGYT